VARVVLGEPERHDDTATAAAAWLAQRSFLTAAASLDPMSALRHE
jgi:hypothetical protein